MTLSSRIVTAVALAGALASAGCAMHRDARVDDTQVARLPADVKSDLVARQRNIDIAESNLATARTGVEDARQFRSLSHDEVKAAEHQLVAAQKGLDIGQRNADARIRATSEDSLHNARLELSAAQSKEQYADRLIAYRQARVEEAAAQLRVARTDLEWSKVQALRDHGRASDLDTQKFIRSHNEAAQQLAAARRHVAELDGEIAQLKTAWDTRRHNVASIRQASPAAPRPLERIPQPPSDVQVPESAPAPAAR